jgi:hypothetical protein
MDAEQAAWCLRKKSPIIPLTLRGMFKESTYFKGEI